MWCQPGDEFDIDIRELISLEDVTERLGLGPNGGLVYCIEHLAENLDWLQERICDNPAECVSAASPTLAL
jgi:hypothetical protein